MCTSSVTLFYGLWVKNWSLAFAAKAYAKAQPTLLALDLIIARRRSGKLVVEQQEAEKTVRDLPQEVWEFIKQEVIDEAIHDEEKWSFEKYRCPSCRLALGEDWKAALARSPHFDLDKKKKKVEDCWTDWNDPRCGSCVDWITGWNGCFDWFWPDQAAKPVTDLLQLVGLRLASSKTICTDRRLHPFFHELSGIAFPKSTPAYDDYPSADADLATAVSRLAPVSDVLGLSSQAFSLPSDADLRFRRFVFTYRLEVVDPTTSTITSTVQGDLAPQRSTLDKPTSAEVSEGKPRWMLCSFARRC